MRYSLPPSYVGRWVRATTNDLGYGVCRGKTTDGNAIVEYTDIPGAVTKTMTVPTQDLELARITPGTRVWLEGKPFGWHAAEVTGWSGNDSYWVHVRGLPRDLKLRGNRFVVRWDKPLSDPVTAVRHGLCDSPEYYEARRPFTDKLVHQRRTSRGFTAALSAAVELYEHQLDTVARVLSDPVLRYLLADEVGLGKTIEAGLIVRQLLLDDSVATVLITVPDTLTDQWRDELRDKLVLAPAFREGRLQVMPHEKLREARGLREHALVVVDEAHRLLRELDRFPILRDDLLNTKGLLLLSATPMRADPAVFRDLLNLVDPEAFPRDDIESFRRRLQQREKEATDLQVLTARRATSRQRKSVLKELLATHGGDPAVARMVQQCEAAEDSSARVWEELANYVRETYRISRRVIRHRRNSDSTQDYPVAGRRAIFIPLDDPARNVVDDFLDRYRELLAEEPPDAARTQYSLAVLNGLGGPRALLHHLKRRLAARPGRPMAVPERDRALVESTVARLELAETGTRMAAALDIVQGHLDKEQKVVIVGTSHAIAREFYEAATNRWPKLVGAHLENTEPHARENAVSDFLHEPRGRVLVGDSTLEEGRNLQGAHTLVNLDLPIDPNRLEQRIGRLDRFARRVRPAEIAVFTEPTSDWVSAHVRLLHAGIGIFDESVATLQRRLAEILDDLVERLLKEGSDAFAADVDELRYDLAQERNDVDLLEELESVAIAADFDPAGVADLRAAEENTDELRDAFLELTSLKSGIGLRPAVDRSGILQFQVKHNAPIQGLPDDKARAVWPLLRGRRTFEREVATEHGGVAPLRIGDPLVEWIDQYLRTDERGRARALIRPCPAVREPVLWMACDFLVEFDASHLPSESETLTRRVRRRGDALLPPTLVRTWTNAFGPAPPRLVTDVLGVPFNEDRDRVLVGRAWDEVLEALPDWASLCRLSADAAHDELRTMPVIAEDPVASARRARTAVAARLAVLRARAERLPSAAERRSARQEAVQEETVGLALVKGVEHPAVSVIACGVVVLWPSI
ncbi:protein DpdE [Pseudonocardia adelaidensis]|uniref:ATP-dependent helicase HepA n=1 Tax=Pseudonocardia adelaidensis TaxID=648754 RepID=A0ABP9NTN5_9PSEU